jgi:hypothetical protein
LNFFKKSDIIGISVKINHAQCNFNLERNSRVLNLLHYGKLNPSAFLLEIAPLVVYHSFAIIWNNNKTQLHLDSRKDYQGQHQFLIKYNLNNGFTLNSFKAFLLFPYF